MRASPPTRWRASRECARPAGSPRCSPAYGTPIQTAAQNVQESVRKAIETMTGLHVVRVDVHVQGVSFEKENKDTQAGLDELHSGVAEVAAQKPAGHVEFEGEPTPAETHNTPDPEPIDVKDGSEPEEV